MVKKLALGLMLIFLLVGIQALVINTQSVNPLVVAASDDGLNLPPTFVRIEASNGTASFFNTLLSNVPKGYDVTNRTYMGWCVDRTAEMARSPATHLVQLYSSISPPGELANEKWDMVNYILNHKQGTALDIQQAIWYFVNMEDGYSPTNNVALNIVNDANANGGDFVPEDGQMIAVICYPVLLVPQAVQISIIEVVNPTSDGTNPPPEDSIAPTVSIVSPENKSYQESTIDLVFTVSEYAYWIGFSLDGQPNATLTGNTTISGLSEGSHRIAVYAYDTAGNVGASENVYFTIDSQQDQQQDQPFLQTFYWIMIAVSLVVVAGGASFLFVKWKRKK